VIVYLLLLALLIAFAMAHFVQFIDEQDASLHRLDLCLGTDTHKLHFWFFRLQRSTMLVDDFVTVKASSPPVSEPGSSLLAIRNLRF